MIGDVLQAKFGNFGVVGRVGHRLKFGNEAKKKISFSYKKHLYMFFALGSAYGSVSSTSTNGSGPREDRLYVV